MKASGKAFFFSFSGDEDHTMTAHHVQGRRVLLEEKFQLLDNYRRGPIYIECRNYFGVSGHSRGSVCCYQLHASPSIWRFGIIYNTIDTLAFQLFTWIGPYTDSSNGDRCTDHQYYPSFFYKSYMELQQPIWSGGYEWCRHFQPSTIMMTDFLDIKYVNLVDGIMKYSKSVNGSRMSWYYDKSHRINGRDIGYEQSLLRCDHIAFPPQHVMKAQAFGQLNMRNFQPSPLIRRDDYTLSYYPSHFSNDLTERIKSCRKKGNICYQIICVNPTLKQSMRYQ